MSQSRRAVIAGNWKMNCLRDEGLALAKAVSAAADDYDCDFVICPPATLLQSVSSAVVGSALAVGGQDCHTQARGAYTGDVAAEMLKDSGCRYVIVGHSERRDYHGESDGLVSEKAQAAFDAGLVAIICIGETEAERDAGRTMTVIGQQLDGSVPSNATAANTIIAYEPVWAIGTGRTATPEQAQEVHAQIRAHLQESHGAAVADGMRILYGGSMKPANAAELLSQKDIDGGLIGGASLSATDFLAIAAAIPK